MFVSLTIMFLSLFMNKSKIKCNEQHDQGYEMIINTSSANNELE